MALPHGWQQNIAPCVIFRSSQNWLLQNFVGFTGMNTSHSVSPDPNPMKYFTCGEVGEMSTSNGRILPVQSKTQHQGKVDAPSPLQGHRKG